MLYAKLVARISEASRTLVARGKTGRFAQNSTVFAAEVDVRESCAGWLKICGGDAGGTYQVVRAQGSEVHVANPFPAAGRDVEWELYDAGVSEEDVRKVLFHFPDILMELEEGEQVKTYLGVVKLVRRKRKRVKDPQGRWTFSPERLQARLRPGKRLQRPVEDEEASEPQDSRRPSTDEDPEP